MEQNVILDVRFQWGEDISRGLIFSERDVNASVNASIVRWGRLTYFVHVISKPC